MDGRKLEIEAKLSAALRRLDEIFGLLRIIQGVIVEWQEAYREYDKFHDGEWYLAINRRAARERLKLAETALLKL